MADPLPISFIAFGLMIAMKHLLFIFRYFPCLGRKVKESEKNEVDKFYELPGEISPKNDQCKEAFGIRSTGCSVSHFKLATFF